MENTNAATGWVVGIIIVALIALAIWWFTSYNNQPGVPNTGATTTSSYTQNTGTDTGATSTGSSSSNSSSGTTGSMGY